jgi:hypothetical protein
MATVGFLLNTKAHAWQDRLRGDDKIRVDARDFDFLLRYMDSSWDRCRVEASSLYWVYKTPFRNHFWVKREGLEAITRRRNLWWALYLESLSSGSGRYRVCERVRDLSRANLHPTIVV